MTDDEQTTIDGQQIIHERSPEIYALRSLAYQLSGADPDETPLPTAARQAVERVDELADRVATLEGAVETNPGTLAYEQMTRKDKTRAVQQALVSKAKQKHNGKAWFDYSTVQAVLEGEPSPGHAYDLMALAAKESGFDYQEPGDKPNRLVVDLDAVNNVAAFHAANKATDQNTA